jgi:hypothetical protein
MVLMVQWDPWVRKDRKARRVRPVPLALMAQ